MRPHGARRAPGDVVYHRCRRERAHGRIHGLPLVHFPRSPELQWSLATNYWRLPTEEDNGMHTLRLVGVVTAFAVLLLASILVFMTLDRYSHSGRDTVLTFIFMVGPVWAGAIGGAWAWLHPAEPRQNGASTSSADESDTPWLKPGACS
jgi:hypothetical protein